jgi:peptidyl-prolyl cis-trans isomerase D
VQAAPLPLDRVKPAVVAAIQMEKGAQAAKAAALRVLDKMKHGGELGATVAGLGVKLPPVQSLSLGVSSFAPSRVRSRPPWACSSRWPRAAPSCCRCRAVGWWF